MIRAGMPRTHYHLPGNIAQPEEQAQFMVENLYQFDPKHNCIALDNEAFPDMPYSVFWRQDDAIRFFREIQILTELPFRRMWHYAGAEPAMGGYRNRGPWDKLEALGVMIWWSAMGNYPTTREPDHEPAVRGSLSELPDIHQFTNKAPLYTKSDGTIFRADGNLARHSVKTLFDL